MLKRVGLLTLGVGLCMGVMTERLSYPVLKMVKGRSMFPTIMEGDVLLFMCPVRGSQVCNGDVVYFRSPQDPENLIVKRVVKLSGEQVGVEEVKGGFRSVWLPFCPCGTNTDSICSWCGERKTIFVPPGHMWVEGDNPPLSKDSRDYGPIAIGLVRGRAVAVCYPLHRIGWIGPKPEVS